MYRWSDLQSMCLGATIAVATPLYCSGEPAQHNEPTEEQTRTVPDSSSAEELTTRTVAPDPTNWVDTSHGYLTDRANVAARWVDNFFGDGETDLLQADSRIRLRFIEDWDETLGNRFRVRVGGKVELPKLSRRLDLVFRGDDPDDDIAGKLDPAQSRVGLQYQLGSEEHKENHRFDLTLGLSSSGPRPGARYAYTGAIAKRYPTRFTQRVQYEFDDGAFATTRLDIDHPLSDDSLIRSFSRVFWGEDSDGAEWSSAVAYAAKWSSNWGRERATFIYSGLSGKTEPYSYVDNYFVGARYRLQAYRDYLFFELEPSYNWRVDEPFQKRKGALKIELRLELLLDNRLRRDSRLTAR